MHPVRGALRRGRTARDLLVDRILGPPFAHSPRTDPLTPILRSRGALHEILVDHIIPFWLERVIDHSSGGYRLHHDTRGTWLGPAPKRSLAQARVAWFFSRLARSPLGEDSHLAIARHGVDFFRRRLWDDQHGGVYWEVSSRGRPTQAHKYTEAQAFWLFALAAYASMTGDSEDIRSAEELFTLIEDRTYDERNGGYLHVFERSWETLQPAARPVVEGWPDLKAANTHLHVMEAYLQYYQLSQSEAARRRLVELMDLLARRSVDPVSGSGFEHCYPDWQPYRRGARDRVGYGHDIERVWMVIDTAEALGVPLSGYLPDLRRLFDAAIRFGYDRYASGFFEKGPRARPPVDRRKTWWVQAEALVAALRMYQITGDPRYGHCFLGTLRWVQEHQVDRRFGDWHAYVHRGGGVEGLKASNIKTPYHNGRAMLMCLDIIDGLERRSG